MNPTSYILAADIGGTSSRFGWFFIDNGRLERINQLHLPTAANTSFREMLEQVDAAGPDGQVRMAVFAVAGAIEQDGSVRPPNISWNIHRDMITPYFPHHTLINDFQAQAFGCLTDLARQAMTIQTGTSEPGKALAVIGAGTGLGHCMLVPDGQGNHVAVASEAGHAAFPFYHDQELAYQAFLHKETGCRYPIGDMIVSGSGLVNLHAFLTGTRLSPAEIAQDFDRFPETLTWFARFYARACRQYCLNVLPTQGLYISGGLAAKHPKIITHPPFIAEFVDSKNYSSLLKNIPIFLNRDEDMGLWGAAQYGRQQVNTARAL
jgi:glucokinase